MQAGDMMNVVKSKRITEAQRERERIQLSKSEVEGRIKNILSWLSLHPVTDPEWDTKVREMHVWEIRLETISTPLRRDEVVGDDFRIITNF